MNELTLNQNAVECIVKIIILVLFLGICSSVFANQYYEDEHGKYIKKYYEKQFDLCECKREGYKLYPNKREDVILKMCEEAFIDYLFKVSEETGEIATGHFYSCKKGE